MRSKVLEILLTLFVPCCRRLQADADIRAFYEAREKLLRAQQAARGGDG